MLVLIAAAPEDLICHCQLAGSGNVRTMVLTLTGPQSKVPRWQLNVGSSDDLSLEYDHLEGDLPCLLASIPLCRCLNRFPLEFCFSFSGCRVAEFEHAEECQPFFLAEFVRMVASFSESRRQ